jgi:peroxiredoxin
MKLLLIGAILAATVGGAAALQDDRAAINKTCPVMKGKLIQKDILAVYKNQPLGFCCEKCKDEWDKDPEEYAANLTTAEPAKTVLLAVLGKPAPELELRDVNGHVARLSDYKKKIVILQWVDRNCKVSERLAKTVMPDMIAKSRKAAESVVHLSVCSDPKATVEAVALHLSDNGVDSRGLMDRDGSTAKIYGALTTCHVFVIDAEGVLRYSGAVDDDPAGKKVAKAVNHVVAAITAVAGGSKVTPDRSKPYGPPLKLLK